MRALISSLTILLFVAQSQATTLYDQLRAFNPHWEQHREALEYINAKPVHNEVDYVQVHLTEVLKVLSGAPAAHLTDGQWASRKELTAVLSEYAEQGRFPINYYRQERIPVFIDPHETHCAVGHLMRHTGHEAMARRIAAANNYAWVWEIQDQGLLAWQQASGFSIEELKLIQGAYDYYPPYAFLLPNKYEVPQKPEQVVRYFEGDDKDKVWCYGEGEDGDLNGRWEQNYSSTLPWITGYFEHGKRAGRWKEYYKGTDKLCRTEHWRNDKLNGIRTRYDREGKVIETILFKEGQAVTKTNIDHDKALRWVRSPIDSATVHTEVFTMEGALIATGNESIHNPEGLSWFQNIELTALNTFAITARDGAPHPEEGVMVRRFDHRFGLGIMPQQIPGSHTLVEYKKEGEWVYFKDYMTPPVSEHAKLSSWGHFANGYMHFGNELYAFIAPYEHLDLTASYDSMRVVYTEDRMTDLFGYTAAEHDHLELSYHFPVLNYIAQYGGMGFRDQPMSYPLKQIARLNAQGDRIGVEEEYDTSGKMIRGIRYLVPFKEEEELRVMRQR